MSSEKVEEVDVLVVGAGFSGLHQLYHLRKLGYKVKVVEAGGGLGGIWHWTTYPGARVDSEVPYYEYSIDELWNEWRWSERYPARDEILKYFAFVDQKLGLSKDIYFNTRVVSAEFNSNTNRWMVKTGNGREFSAKFLDLCLGYVSKPYIPEFEGMHEFKGVFHHSNNFPLKKGEDFKGKRVAVIGTGASGVQVIQEIGPVVSHLTVFQRTPNYAIPMANYPLSPSHYDKMLPDFPHMFRRRFETFGGISYTPTSRGTFEDSTEIRIAFYEKLWSSGNFEFWVGGYGDIFVDEKANKEAYNFWCQKTRARIHDPAKRDILAPLSPPHPFGTKRPSLETRYYEVFNQSNVSLVNTQANPILSFTPSGIRTEDGVEREFDIVVLATGFDAVTGGMNQIRITGINGITLEEKWKTGVKTYLGVSSSGFPNLFFLYGAQGPSALSNGPACLEYQGNWVVNIIDHVMKSGKSRIDPEERVEGEWANHVEELYNFTLFAKTESYYSGANIPGKNREALCYSGGIPAYIRHCDEKAEHNYEGFVLV